jgi:hypothetical protein
LENIPRRILRMAAFTGVLIGVAMAFNYLVNPYGAWRIAIVNPIFRNLTGERAQMPYQLRTAAPETLLIGSSRVQVAMRIEQGYRDGVLNASLGAATIPDLTQIVSLALQNPKLKRIVWGVDFYAFNARVHHVNPGFEARLALDPGILVEDSLLSLGAIGDSIDVLKRAIGGLQNLKPAMAANVPWPPELICAQFIAQHDHGLAVTGPANIEIALAQVESWFYAGYEFSPEAAARFREVVNMAAAHNVEVILFVPPMSEYELELIRQGGHWPDFERFKRTVAAAGPLWDFAAYNHIANTDALFLDVLHLKPAAGNAILRIMLGMQPASCDGDANLIAASGVRLDPGSIDNILSAENRGRDEAAAQTSRYSRLAASALRDPRSRRSANSSEIHD